MAEATSPRVRRLEAKRARLVKQILDLNREIREIERQTGKKAPPSTARLPESAVVRKPNARRLNQGTVADAIVRLLKSRRRPMHYREIAEVLQRDGLYVTKSKNFLSTVAITILRDKRFKRVEPGVYDLKRR